MGCFRYNRTSFPPRGPDKVPTNTFPHVPTNESLLFPLVSHQNGFIKLSEIPPSSGSESSGPESTDSAARELSIVDLQQHIHQMYYEKDVARGVEGTFMWLMEEVGELSSALRGNDRENLAEEFADVIAWLATIANVAQIDLNAALVAKYGHGCPGCHRLVCECPDSEKP